MSRPKDKAGGGPLTVDRTSRGIIAVPYPDSVDDRVKLRALRRASGVTSLKVSRYTMSLLEELGRRNRPGDVVPLDELLYLDAVHRLGIPLAHELEMAAYAIAAGERGP